MDINLKIIDLVEENLGFSIKIAQHKDAYSYRVSGLGDINGDSLEDLAFSHVKSMSGYNNNDGQVIVIYARKSGFPSDISVADDILSQGLCIYNIK